MADWRLISQRVTSVSAPKWHPHGVSLILLYLKRAYPQRSAVVVFRKPCAARYGYTKVSVVVGAINLTMRRL